jgi:pimeloyl-ACP methyl ester carboxylesterase
MKSPYCLITTVLLLSFVPFFFPGCSMMHLYSESKELEKISELTGVVEASAFQGKPIVIVLLSVDPASTNQWKAAVARRVLSGPGPFHFYAPPGTYNIGAFEDLNENETFQAEEPVGWYGAPDTIEIADKNNRDGLNIVLRSPEQARKELPHLYQYSEADVSALRKELRLGEIVTLDDPAFSRENGHMGLWEPMRFFKERRSGIFFLEPYDPKKIPILFVHGAGGNPAEWRSIINALDRNRFQPWVLFYPSGLRLDIIRQGVDNGMARLRIRHKFDHLYLVAHSMGGLVAGGVINNHIENGNAESIRLFVTLSTPWGGHELAASGVANSPAVIPSWYDMVPGSPYQEALFKQSLPEHLEYHLLFSHHGQFNIMSGGNTDGAVSLKSQLIYPAQERALHIRGYDEDHVRILSSPQVIEHLNQIFIERLTRDSALQ